MNPVPEQVFLQAAAAYARMVATRRSHELEVARRSAADPAFRAAVKLAYYAGQAATPDGPRTWALPDGATVVRIVTTPTEWQQATEAIYGPFPPGNPPFDVDPSVDELSRRAARDGALHVQVMPLSPPPPRLTDATPAADGQDAP